MKKYLLISLSLILTSCSTLQQNRIERQDDKHSHILTVLTHYPQAIIVGGLDTDIVEQLAKYYNAKNTIGNESTDSLLYSSNIAIQRDSLTGEVLGATIPSGILFGFDRYDLEEEQQAVIDSLIRLLGTDKKQVYIIGHTDSIGSEKYNQALSEKRAVSVRNYLETNYSEIMEVVKTLGLGESEPIATNETETGRQQNRRVEIIIRK